MASTFEALLLSQLNFLQNKPGALLWQSAQQTIANAAWTATNFDSSIRDNYSGHSNSVNPSRYTCQVPGVYSVKGGGGWATSASGSGRGASIYKNGAIYTDGGSAVVGNSGVAHVTPAGTDVVLAAGDYIELFVWQNSGGSLLTSGVGQYSSYLAINWESFT